ncbi:MAG: MFS transporter [Anaerolineae bacterium]|nr:MFS transporter [Anaerolineae bacterium]
MIPITPAVSLPGKFRTFFGISLQVMIVVFFARLILDIGTRVVFPFIPQLSAGLGLTVVGFSWLLFIRGIIGVAGPIFGVWSDRYGRRNVMAVGLLCQALGMVGLTLSWQWWAILPMLFFGLGLTAFIPPQQAYISDQVAYERRGRALAIVEASWAIAAIVFLPLIGWLIDAFGWRVPFFIVSFFSLLGALVVWRYLPSTAHHTQTNLSWTEMRQLCLRPNVLASIFVALLLFITVDCFISVWGIWLSADYGLDAAALGLVATGIGLAELMGSASSSLFIDRIGKRRGSGLGLFLAAVILLLLPLTQSFFFLAVATLVIAGAFIEFTIVSLIPLYSEQAPQARGTVFSLILLGSAIGGAMGTPIAATGWERFGLGGVCAIAAACLLAALALMGRFLREELHH